MKARVVQGSLLESKTTVRNAEQTMQREPKWIDMPLSTEGNSNRTHRSFFAVPSNDMMRSQPNVLQSNQTMHDRRQGVTGTGSYPKLHNTMGAASTNRIHD